MQTHTGTDIRKSSAHLSCFPENTVVLKVHYVEFGMKFSSEEKQTNLTKKTLWFFMTEWIKYTNWPQRITHFHNVLLCLYVADPATFLASNSVLGTLFSPENSLLFCHGRNKYIWVCVIASVILWRLRFWICSPKLHSAPFTQITG